LTRNKISSSLVGGAQVSTGTGNNGTFSII
jgi:hypothetical protein